MSQLQEDTRVNTRKPERLGEELPIFCEKCGYNLSGLTVTTCSHCQVMHFECPECGHHQPINTLRPAFQRILGRMRGVFLAGVVFIKIVFFVSILLAWFGMGAGLSYEYRYQSTTGSTIVPMRISREALVACAMFAIPFGAVSRMLLLRWRRGYLVGAVVAAMVIIAMSAGAVVRQVTEYGTTPAPPWTMDWLGLEIYSGGIVCLFAALAWPIWVGLTRAFLPKRTAALLLDWQRNLSQRSVAEIGRGA
jgi:hypothetical protein